MTYSCFRSASDRFGKGSFLDYGEPNQGEYNTDTAHKKTMVHESNDSPFVLSNMNSKTSRFGDDSVGKDAAWNASYDIDKGHKKTLSTSVEDTAVVYSNIRTKTKRFPHRMPFTRRLTHGAVQALAKLGRSAHEPIVSAYFIHSVRACAGVCAPRHVFGLVLE